MPFKGRILLADDEQTFREATADLLREAGYECQTARDSATAAAEINTGHFDLLIADINMPGNPQLELIQHLADVADGLPVILITAYPTPGTKAVSADLPVVSYLTKPVDFDELLVQVTRCICQTAIRRTNHAILKRVDAWSRESAHTEEILRTRGAAPPVTSPEAFVNLTMRHILGCLNELNTMWQTVSEVSAPSVIKRPDALGDALQSAVRTFESSKQSFRP